MIAILTVALAALVSVVVGLPWAVLLRRRRDDLATLLGDSALIGLLFVVVGLSVYSWIGAVGLGLCVLLELGVVAFIATRRSQFSWPALPVRRELVWFAVFVVILLVALVLRRHPSDFIEYTGDMGAYTSWANQFLRTGSLTATWPPAFSMFLVLGGLLTGGSGVTAIVPLTGVFLVVAAVRLLRMIGVNRWIGLVVGAAIAVHPASIWFSRITLSESLNAPLLLLWLVAVVGVLQNAGAEGSARRRLGWTLVGGTGMLALSLLRGTAPILVLPVVLIAVIALIAPRWRHLAPGLWAFLLANAAGAMIGYWYGVDRITDYYVNLQLKEILPGRLFRELQRIGLLHVGTASAIAAIAVVVVMAAIFVVIRRLYRVSSTSGHAKDDDNVGVIVRVIEILSGVLLAAVVFQSAQEKTDVWQILNRLGIALVIAAMLAPLLVAVTRHTRARATILIVSTLLAAVFAELQISRLAEVRPHIVFLYWDRYLYSEFFPLMMVLVGLSLSVVLEVAAVLAKRRFGEETAGRRVVGITGVALLLATVVMIAGILPQTALIEQQTELQGAGAIQSDLSAAMPNHKQTVVWGASAPGQVVGSGFPNTWQAFGLPLSFEYGYPFDNAGRTTANGALPDAILGPADLARATTCSGSKTFYVVESEMPGGTSLARRIDPSQFSVKQVASVDQLVEQLAQPAVGGWSSSTFHFSVYQVTAAASPGAFSKSVCAYKATF